MSLVLASLTACAGADNPSVTGGVDPTVASQPTSAASATTDDAPTTSATANPDDTTSDGTTGDDTTGDDTTGDGAPDLPQEPTGECRDVLAWAATEPFADAEHVSHPLPSFARAGYYYVHTMRTDGSDRRMMFAALGPGGAPAAWQVASPDHGGGPHGFTAVVADGEAYHFRNGHIARFVFAPDGTMAGDVELLEDSPDTAFGGNKYVWDSAVYLPLLAGDHLVHLGGFSFTGYTYRPDIYRSPVPLAASFSDTGLDHPSGQRPGKAAFYAPPAAAGGYIYTGRGDGPELWRGEVGDDGALLGWSALPQLPEGTDNQRGDLFVAGRTLFAVRGAAVLRADLGPTGEPGAWTAAAPLPEPQIDVHWGEGHVEGAAHAVVDAHVYLTGPKRVFFAELAPRACAGE